MANPTCLPATDVTSTGGTINGSADNIPPTQFIRVAYSATPGGPYTPGINEAGTNTLGQQTNLNISPLAPGTTTYYVLQELDTDGTTVLATSSECSFTTTAAPGTSFVPMPCTNCGGAGGVDPVALDAEQLVMCDVNADGEVVGTALMVTLYPDDGTPPGPPTPVDPATGDPYVVQGTLQVCPGTTGCLDPVQFCFTTTTTGPVDHPGRQYDLDLPINPGFAVQSLQVDQVTSAANIVWDVADPDGEAFRTELTGFIEARIPSSAVVTITNPNAGNVICGTAAPMHVHIECIRLDQAPPNLIELVYNGGQDLVLNPAYNETPPLNPPVSQGNYGFHLLSRQDDPGPFPGNQPANDANCTNVANRGWETNDIGRTFEIWGQDQVNAQNVTPTPRGTPVQEISSDGPPPGGLSTIWQTFQAPSTGNFVIRVVHGARDAGEVHRITLDNGDTDDAQNGDLIDDTTNPGVVTSSPGGPGPWTTFTQTIPLTAGNIYTLSLSSTNPVIPNRGGLFTDMRAYIDQPDLRATATTDDDTCVVTVEETTTTTTCEYWSPLCENGDITAWKNAEDGEVLDNAAFWGQTPSPECCLPTASDGGGGQVSAGNLVHSYLICGVVGGVSQTLSRVVYTDQSGGVLASSIIGPDGGPVVPTSWIPGECSASGGQTLGETCYQTPDAPGFTQQGFMALNAAGNPVLYDLSGGVVPVYNVVICADNFSAEEILCDAGNANHQFVRRYIYSAVDNLSSQVPAPADFELDGFTAYVAVGPVGVCGDTSVPDTRDAEVLVLCDATPTRFLRKYLYDGETGAFVGIVNTTLDGTTPFAPVGAVGICSTPTTTDFDFLATVLCDSNGTQFIQRLTFNSATGAVTSTTNTTLTGGAFVPVGTVSLCANCCPVEIGSGCYNAGSGRYTALRLANGTISLIDSVTGAAVLAGQIVPCADDDTPVTLTAQHRLIGDADAAWSPGADVVGTLVSVTYTVLSGTATVTDQSGTVAAGLPAGLSATWSAEDNNTLSGPQSIDAVAGNTYVVWVQR